MSDYYDIREVGGDELAKHYPDRGLIPDVNWHRAIVIVTKAGRGWFGKFRKREKFIAVLSANADGLRIFVSLDKFAVFVPWSALSVAAERSTPATLAHLQMADVPSVQLDIHLNDEAADDLFRGVIAPLPQRDPPRHLFWLKPWAQGALLVTMLGTAVLLAVLQLSWLALVGTVVVVSVILVLVLHGCRSLLEDKH
jgi:hypothetical protein